MAMKPSSLISLFKLKQNSGLGLIAILYICIDYFRHISTSWHQTLQTLLWVLLILAAIVRGFFYTKWSIEFRSLIPFLIIMFFMLFTLLLECISVRFTTAVLGLTWHRDAPSLPDPGQWLLLAANEKLPSSVVEILRARIVGLEHYLILFMMLAFSVLFNSVKAPGFGLGARYMFTMAVGRILRTITFVSTILPSLRPWCASNRFDVPAYPHPWAQKYYMPYASDAGAIRLVLQHDKAYADAGIYPDEFRPDWGSMSFLIDILRPTESKSSWYRLLTASGGGCNDLVFSGHMFVAVLTAMAWTEAYGGWTSSLIWLLVLHSAQREVRERNHYSVDVVVAIYVGILLWRTTKFLWSAKDASVKRRLLKLEKIQGRLVQAAKDSDMDEIRDLLKEVDLGSQDTQESSQRSVVIFGGITLLSVLTIALLTLRWTSDG
ncbi:hypothetical protein AQUCO_02300157v1 [Aquilegia coerulea]|uniref:Sphingomyelin synthase-like domain-containing protein n=1 Tax=Aquilegia coerulea TaxID=218851 RepID=A0A2G5DCF2_AQUCA|nr:hypothetical protein AQUCO_02300157v1 [Aquilegia coerulea]